MASTPSQTNAFTATQPNHNGHSRLLPHNHQLNLIVSFMRLHSAIKSRFQLALHRLYRLYRHKMSFFSCLNPNSSVTPALALRSITFTQNFIFITHTLPFFPGKCYAYMRYMRYVETKFHFYARNPLSF
jgi:hypothetical protein